MKRQGLVHKRDCGPTARCTWNLIMMVKLGNVIKIKIEGAIEKCFSRKKGSKTASHTGSLILIHFS